MIKVYNDSLKDMLRQKLMECGWRDNLKTYCKGEFLSISFNKKEITNCNLRSFAEIIRSKGLEKITVDQLVEEVTPRGRGDI